jgi:hypothetical protein
MKNIPQDPDRRERLRRHVPAAAPEAAAGRGRGDGGRSRADDDLPAVPGRGGREDSAVRLRTRFAVLAACVACLALGVVSPGRAAGAADADLAAVDRAAGEAFGATRLPGMALAVTRGSQVVLVKGYGTAGAGKPVTATTQFRIASLSKSFTATAVLQLVEAGRVDLDSRASPTTARRPPPWRTGSRVCGRPGRSRHPARGSTTSTPTTRSSPGWSRSWPASRSPSTSGGRCSARSA